MFLAVSARSSESEYFQTTWVRQALAKPKWSPHVWVGVVFVAIGVVLCAFSEAKANSDAPLQSILPRALPKINTNSFRETLLQHRGQPILINFWATWCAPCREEMSSLGQQAKIWRARGLIVHTVAVADSASAVNDFMGAMNIPMPVLHDRDQSLARAFGVRVIPTTLVLDRHHRVVLRGSGAINWQSPKINQQLQRLFFQQ